MMRWLALWVALLCVAAAAVPAMADDEVDWEWVEPDLPPPGPRPDPSTVDNLSASVATKLRCPVCASASVGDSSAEFAQNMRVRIRELVAAGYTEDQILDYYAEGYGERILLRPVATGLNWILWLAPAIGTVLGVTWLAVVVQGWRREPDPVPLPSDVGEAPLDPYEERLLRELDE